MREEASIYYPEILVPSKMVVAVLAIVLYKMFNYSSWQ